MKQKISFSPHFFRSYTIWIVISLLLTSAILAVLLPQYSHEMTVFPWPMLADALVPLIFLGCAILFCRRWCALAAVLSSFFVFTVRVGALVIFKNTLMPFSLFSLQLLWMHTDQVSLPAFLGRNYLWWMIPTLLLWMTWIIVSAVFAWKCNFEGHFLRHRFNKVLLVILLILAIGFNIGYGVTTKMKSTTVYTGSQVKPLLYTGAETVRIIYREIAVGRSRGVPGVFLAKFPAESETVLREYGLRRQGKTWLHLKEKTPRFDRIIIIAVESLDLDFIGALNPAMPQGVTPELDRLVAKYPTLTRYYAASQPTSWAIDALLASRMDYTQDLADYDNASLPEIVQQLGFQTSYYASCSGIFANNREDYEKLFKFQKIVFLEELQQFYHRDFKTAWGVTDHDLLECVLADLKKTSGKQFVVISTMDTHPPYARTEKPEKKPFSASPFLNALHETDRNLGNFIRQVMADQDLYNARTLIVVTADHTATHGENFLHRRDFAPERIPLIFITPDDSVFRAIPKDGFASSIDFAPTLVHLLGMDVPPTFMGQDLRIAKNAALSRSPGNILYVRTPEGEWRINMNLSTPKNPQQKVFFDYYRAFYEE